MSLILSRAQAKAIYGATGHLSAFSKVTTVVLVGALFICDENDTFIVHDHRPGRADDPKPIERYKNAADFADAYQLF